MEENKDDKIAELEEMLRENNKLIQKIHKNLRFQTILKTTYWIVVITGLVLAYFAIRPTYKAIKTNLNNQENSQHGDAAVEDYQDFKPFLNPNGTFLNALKNIFN